MDEQIADTKPCPICAEMVRATARKCRYCNEFIDGKSSKGRWPRWTGFNGKTLWEWITVLIFPALLGTAGIWVARAQYEFEVRAELSEQATAVAGATATSLSNLATLEAGIAFQATQEAQHRATSSVVTAEAQSTKSALAADANVRAAEASGNRSSIDVASVDATVQALEADAAVRSTLEAINADAAAAESTQAAVSIVTAEARATADAIVLEATIASAVDLPTVAATPPLTVTATLIAPTHAPTFTVAPLVTQTITATVSSE